MISLVRGPGTLSGFSFFMTKWCRTRSKAFLKSSRQKCLGARPYLFEPHWLISTIWVAHFHFWSFHSLSWREFHSCVIVYTYSSLANLWFCNLWLEITKKLLKLSSLGIGNFQNHLFRLPAPDVNLILIFSIFLLVSKFPPEGSCLGSLIHNLALPLSKLRRVYQSNF